MSRKAVLLLGVLCVVTLTRRGVAAGGQQDPTQALLSPFPVGSGATLATNGSTGSATLGIMTRFDKLHFQAGLLGQTSGGSGPAASPTGASGALKVGFGIEIEDFYDDPNSTKSYHEGVCIDIVSFFAKTCSTKQGDLDGVLRTVASCKDAYKKAGVDGWQPPVAKTEVTAAAEAAVVALTTLAANPKLPAEWVNAVRNAGQLVGALATQPGTPTSTLAAQAASASLASLAASPTLAPAWAEAVTKTRYFVDALAPPAPAVTLWVRAMAASLALSTLAASPALSPEWKDALSKTSQFVAALVAPVRARATAQATQAAMDSLSQLAASPTLPPEWKNAVSDTGTLIDLLGVPQAMSQQAPSSCADMRHILRDYMQSNQEDKDFETLWNQCRALNPKEPHGCAISDVAAAYPNVAKAHAPRVAWQAYLNVIPSFSSVSVEKVVDGAPVTSSPTTTSYFLPVLITVDVAGWTTTPFGFGLELGGGWGLPKSLQTATSCTTIMQGQSTLQNCAPQPVALGQPSLVPTLFVTPAFIVNPIAPTSGFPVMPGFGLTATIQLTEDPLASTPVTHLFSSNAGTVTFNLPIFLTRTGSWNILGGVVPQVAVPINGGAPKPSFSVFVGSGIFTGSSGSGPASGGGGH